MQKKYLFLASVIVTALAAAVWWQAERKDRLPAASALAALTKSAAHTAGPARAESATVNPAGPAISAKKQAGPVAAAPVAQPHLSPAVVFGAIAPVVLQDVPAGRFHDQLAKLSPVARARALKHLGESHIPLLDVDSLSVDRAGMLVYACAFIPAGAQPKNDLQPSQTVALAEGVSATPVPISSPPIRHSKPGATNVIYLDFNGLTITGTAWNDIPTYVAKPFDKDGDPTTFNDQEQSDIIHIWERVAEDYKPFNVDVTTEDPVTFTNSTGRILITPNVDANGVNMPYYTAGGVAWVGVFGSVSYAYYSPALVYSNQLSNNEAYIAEACSHEMGHNMGLSHDAQTSGNTSYYPGHGSGETSWGPIMGTGYGRNVSQWSKGEYYLANNTEDDLAIISGRLGYQTDDYGDTNGTAAPVAVAGNTISALGVISQTGEADRFSFTTGAGNVAITASPFRSAVDTYGGNLDIQLELIDAGNNVLSTTNPAATTGLTLNTTLAAGTYYLRITGVGTGTPLSSTPTGYTSYASLGAYNLSGTIAVAAFNKFSAGRYHSLRLNAVSLLYATGTNTYGQLGTGNTTTFSTPQQITLPGQTVVDLAAGGQHSLIQTSANDLWATGINDNGQLNDGTIVAKSTPIKIATSVAGMAASVFHSAYLKTDGTLWTVGLNDEGQLGTGNLTEIHTAAQIATNVVDLAVGNRQTLFVKSDGTLWGAGDLYNNGTLTSTPIQIATSVKTVAAGAYHSLILKTDGTLWTLGFNAYGQLGNNDATHTTLTVPVQIATGVKAIAAGYFHSAYIKTDNTLWTFGYNSFGQIGDGTANPRIAPFQLATNVTAVSASESYTLFMKTDGSLWGTGLNGNGQFGNGLTTTVSTPVQISVGTISAPSVPTGVTAVSNAAADRINLAWQPMGTAVGYEIWRSTTNSFGSATRIAQNVRWAFYQDLTASAYTPYYYWVTAVNSAGTSSPSTAGSGSFGAPIAPGFSTQPLPQSVAAGVTATFTVATSGYPFPTVQWQRLAISGGGWTNLSNNAVYGGVTTTTLTVTGLTGGMTGDQFRCIATNSVSTATSTAVTLTVTIANDFNSDGNSDIVWQDTVTGERYLWLMNGTAYGTGQSLGTVSTDWRIAATGDFNGDGKTDILWENTTSGDRGFWLMNGTTMTSWVDLGIVPTAWHIATAGEFNGDGKTDIVWENTSTGDRGFWLMNGTNLASWVDLGVVTTDLRIVGAGDFNGDGKSDLVWENTVTGKRVIWLMNGTTFVSAYNLGIVTSDWHVAAVADYNGDGKPDILYENTITGERYLWLMNGTAFVSGLSFGIISTDWRIAN